MYYSALLSAPAKSIVKKQFFKKCKFPWILQFPQVEDDWNDLWQTLEGHKKTVNALTFSHDDKQLASASFDRTIRLWNLEKGTCTTIDEENVVGVIALVFSQNGDQLASVSYGGTVRLWNPEKGTLTETLQGYRKGERLILPSHGPKGPPF